MQEAWRAASRAWAKTGNRITTRSSMSVKPRRGVLGDEGFRSILLDPFSAALGRGRITCINFSGFGAVPARISKINARHFGLSGARFGRITARVTPLGRFGAPGVGRR